MTKIGSFEIVKEGDTQILYMNNDENRFSDTFVKEFNQALDAVEKHEGPGALIITAKGKFFSNGLDLNYLGTLQTHAEIFEFLIRFQRLLGRILTFPMPTIAAINGHCFAGGAMLSMACDYRVMRADRGFWCLPEVDLKMALGPGMNAIAQSKITDAALYREIILTGKRYNGVEAQKNKIVDEIVPEAELLKKSLEIANRLAPKSEDRETLAALKREMYYNAYTLLNSEDLREIRKKFAKL
eukprot:TRINITY_DN9264_c0_g1_i1.p1 TRINITY_DN9264_c0_g1~~TRINITY_DN9264_c0_g1_i1.p1  ORF type:complete len:241 (-),score=41.74 TRINITY_DN9264_c0_g1_i1:292-1014(-)